MTTISIHSQKNFDNIKYDLVYPGVETPINTSATSLVSTKMQEKRASDSAAKDSNTPPPYIQALTKSLEQTLTALSQAKPAQQILQQYLQRNKTIPPLSLPAINPSSETLNFKSYSPIFNKQGLSETPHAYIKQAVIVFDKTYSSKSFTDKIDLASLAVFEMVKQINPHEETNPSLSILTELAARQLFSQHLLSELNKENVTPLEMVKLFDALYQFASWNDTFYIPSMQNCLETFLPQYIQQSIDTFAFPKDFTDALDTAERMLAHSLPLLNFQGNNAAAFETLFARALSQKLVVLLAEINRTSYLQTGKLSQDISAHLDAILAFQNKHTPYTAFSLPSAPQLIQQFIIGIFGTDNLMPEKGTLQQLLSAAAQKPQPRTWSSLLFRASTAPLPPPSGSTELSKLNNEKLKSIDWAEAQLKSTSVIFYPQITDKPVVSSLQSLTKPIVPKPTATPSVSQTSQPSAVITPAPSSYEHTSYLHLVFKGLETQDAETIWETLPLTAQIDALHHIRSWQSLIEDHPNRFPVEYKLMRWLQATRGPLYRSLSPLMSTLKQASSPPRSTSQQIRQGEAVLDFYYDTQPKNTAFYTKLLKMIDDFGRTAPQLFNYLSEQAQSAGWKDFETEWQENSYSRPNTFLHTIVAIERYLHVRS